MLFSPNIFVKLFRRKPSNCPNKNRNGCPVNSEMGVRIKPKQVPGLLRIFQRINFFLKYEANTRLSVGIYNHSNIEEKIKEDLNTK